jgi:hypothetical protein
MSTPTLGQQPLVDLSRQPKGSLVPSWAAAREIFRLEVAILGALPLVLFCIDRNWSFSDLFNDAWIYFGYFLNLPNHLRAFRDRYYSDRLTVIIPGYLCHRTLPDVPAHLLLHLGLYHAAIFSTYLTLLASVGRRAAFLAAFAMGSHFFFLKSIGWDYCDGFGVAYLCMTIGLLEVGGDSRWRKTSLIFAGATAAATVVANPGYLLLLLPLIPIRFLRHRDGRWRARIGGILLFALGAILLVVALEGAYFALTGSWWRYEGTGRFVARIAGRMNKFRYPPSEWRWQACWLVFPGMMAVAGMVLIVRRGRRVITRPWPPSMSYPLLLIMSLLIYWLSDVITKSLFFQCFYYSSMLMPSAFLTLGAVLDDLLAPLTGRQYLSASVCAAVLFIAPNALPPLGPIMDRCGFPPVALAVMPWIVAVAYGSSIRNGLHRCLLFLLPLGLSQTVASHEFKIEYCLPPSMGFQFQGDRLDDERLEVLQLIGRTVRSILASHPAAESYFWYDVEEPLGLLFKAIACTHCEGPRSFGMHFPLTNGHIAGTGEELRPGDTLVVLRSHAEIATTIEVVRTKLLAFGLQARPESARRYKASRIEYSMIIFEIGGTGSASSRRESSSALLGDPSMEVTRSQAHRPSLATDREMNPRWALVRDILVCPDYRRRLAFDVDRVCCTACRRSFPIRGGKIYFTEVHARDDMLDDVGVEEQEAAGAESRPARHGEAAQ